MMSKARAGVHKECSSAFNAGRSVRKNLDESLGGSNLPSIVVELMEGLKSLEQCARGGDTPLRAPAHVLEPLGRLAPILERTTPAKGLCRKGYGVSFILPFVSPGFSLGRTSRVGWNPVSKSGEGNLGTKAVGVGRGSSPQP